MLKKVQGIITKTVKYGESSVIFDLLTEEDGVRSFIIGGVRKKGSKNKSALVRVLNLVDIQAYVKDNDSLSRVKEISYSYIYQSIPFDVAKGSVATFLIEICRKSIKATDNSIELYHFIVKGLIHLDNMNTGLAHFHIRFLIDLTSHLGFEMNDNYSSTRPFFDLRDGTFKINREDHRLSLDEDHSRYLNAYMRSADHENVPREGRRVLLLSMVDFYRYHINDFGELKSLDILMSLYE